MTKFENIMKDLLEKGKATFHERPGSNKIEWGLVDEYFGCFGQWIWSIYDPKSVRMLEKAYNHCTTGDDCIGCPMGGPGGRG